MIIETGFPILLAHTDEKGLKKPTVLRSIGKFEILEFQGNELETALSFRQGDDLTKYFHYDGHFYRQMFSYDQHAFNPDTALMKSLCNNESRFSFTPHIFAVQQAIIELQRADRQAWITNTGLIGANGGSLLDLPVINMERRKLVEENRKEIELWRDRWAQYLSNLILIDGKVAVRTFEPRIRLAVIGKRAAVSIVGTSPIKPYLESPTLLSLGKTSARLNLSVSGENASESFWAMGEIKELTDVVNALELTMNGPDERLLNSVEYMNPSLLSQNFTNDEMWRMCQIALDTCDKVSEDLFTQSNYFRDELRDRIKVASEVSNRLAALIHTETCPSAESVEPTFLELVALMNAESPSDMRAVSHADLLRLNTGRKVMENRLENAPIRMNSPTTSISP